MRLRHLTYFVAVALLEGALATNVWAQAPMGDEFRLNAYTTGIQFWPAVASDGNGDFVAVWSGPQDGSSAAIVGRRFDAAGVPLGPEFRVDTTDYNANKFAATAVSGDGSFVVVWEFYGADGAASGVIGRRFSAAGVPLTGEFAINAYTTYQQHSAKVAADAAGNFVVVWTSQFQDGSALGVFGRRFDAGGAPLGGEFLINTVTTNNEHHPAVASTPGGAFVVVWQSNVEDGDGYGVFGRLYDSAGAPVGVPFAVNTYTTDDQERPAVAMGPDGAFVVVWNGRGENGDRLGVFARRFAADGTPGLPFQVNTYTTHVLWRPSVAIDRGGTVMVAWHTDFQDGSYFGVFGRQYDALGNPLGGEFQVNTFTPFLQNDVTVTAVARGDFMVAWDSDLQDGSDRGIFGQRYGDLIFRDGAETGDLARWSSASTDGGNLSVQPGAALADTALGLQALVDDTNPLFVRDDRPDAEDQYRARFYFDTNGFDPGEATNNLRVRLFIAHDDINQRLATIVLRRLGGDYALMGRVRRDDGTRADTAFHAITDGSHMVELRWQRATGPAAADGLFVLRIDDVEVSALTGLDNGDRPVDYARLGVMAIKSPTSAGTMYFDQFESRRSRPIGPE